MMLLPFTTEYSRETYEKNPYNPANQPADNSGGNESTRHHCTKESNTFFRLASLWTDTQGTALILQEQVSETMKAGRQ